MTTSSASARPYSVFVGALDTDFDDHVRRHTYVDRGLSPLEVDSLDSPSDLKKLALTSLVGTPVTPLILLALAVWGVAQWVQGSAAGTALWAAVAAAVAAVIVVSYRTRNTITGRLKSLTGELLEAGRLANPSEGQFDLRRIQDALTTLQASKGTDFDELARKAVIAVLDQNLKAPSPKTLAIAESKASDPDSTVIRARVQAQKAQRDADVAKAESLIFDLEQFAAETKTQGPLTAG